MESLPHTQVYSIHVLYIYMYMCMYTCTMYTCTHHCGSHYQSVMPTTVYWLMYTAHEKPVMVGLDKPTVPGTAAVSSLFALISREYTQLVRHTTWLYIHKVNHIMVVPCYTVHVYLHHLSKVRGESYQSIVRGLLVTLHP